jgi:hypothetical protein
MKLTRILLVDGYTRTANIIGLYGTIEFKYRPARPEERAIVIEKCTKVTADGSERVTAAALAAHILDWNIASPNSPNEVADITAENLLMLPPDAFNRMVAIVIYGSDPGDSVKGKVEDDAVAAEANFADEYSARLEKN